MTMEQLEQFILKNTMSSSQEIMGKFAKEEEEKEIVSQITDEDKSFGTENKQVHAMSQIEWKKQKEFLKF